MTAIGAGDTDGIRHSTHAGWIGLAVTPAHPEYPAAHGCWTGATARILERFTGTNVVHFALDSMVTGTMQVFETTDDLRAEIINARVYGGMHFRNSVEVGAWIGEQVADWVAFSSDPSLDISRNMASATDATCCRARVLTAAWQSPKCGEPAPHAAPSRDQPGRRVAQVQAAVRAVRLTPIRRTSARSPGGLPGGSRPCVVD